ncbi:amidohydrolase [Oscillibacter sp. MSJ-2]|uniref:Amidohydrolase n=1 Tax=Dysosmobacter acutus TaxID=2841504 RepID=A0ABS6F600_9FIRM|nr:amidohydrolase [Dysosmobacter acutus]MBU5625587.1 amidohydrolase [Dysosmobacter acutus]
MATAYVNGKIYTMKSENDAMSAVVVDNGKFLYCGNDDEARRIVTEGKAAGAWETGEIVDLGGKCVLPGFIDNHQHVQTYAKNALKVDLSDATSIVEVKERIRERIAREPEGKLILGCAFDDTRFDEKRLPTRWDLDEVSPNNPVLIGRYCTHISVANSLALQKCGISEESALTEGYERDAEHRLTGCMHEREAAEMVNVINGGVDLSYEELKDIMGEALHRCNSYGITSIHPIQGKMCNLFEKTDLYQDLYDEGRLSARIYMGDDELPGCSIRTGLGDDMMKYGFYKIYTDGSLGGHTALMTRPYYDVPETSGTCHYNQEELDEMVKAAYDRNIQIGVHAIGDQAVEMTLTALKKAYEANPRPWDQIRFRLIHCSLINPKIIEMLKELRVIIDMQPGYVSTNIHWSDDRVGPDRAPYLFAWKTLMNMGLTLCGSSDHPCENLNPLVGIYAVETRSGYDGYLPKGWQPQERLSRYEAVCLYTKNAAYSSFDEDKKGTIEVGKLADFTVFDQDVFGVQAPELLKIKVEKTYLGGREVYSRS